MNVVYKPTITEQILMAKADAYLSRREIDFIALDVNELVQLERETFDYYEKAMLSTVLIGDEFTMFGVRLIVA